MKNRETDGKKWKMDLSIISKDFSNLLIYK